MRSEVCADDRVSKRGHAGAFTWKAVKNRYSLRPVGDVAKHEAASVIGQPAHDEGYDHGSWTRGGERARLSEHHTLRAKHRTDE